MLVQDSSGNGVELQHQCNKNHLFESFGAAQSFHSIGRRSDAIEISYPHRYDIVVLNRADKGDDRNAFSE